MLKFLEQIWEWAFPDKRSEAEKEKEREFIQAVNQLKTLRVTSHGRMSIDPEEIRDQVLQSRESYKDLISPLHRKQNPEFDA